MKILPIRIGNVKPIYYVSEDGVIYDKNMKIKKETIDRYGYKYSTYIMLDGKRKKLKSHRVVAYTFQENTENKPTVNHIDGDKLNNANYNLEFATHKEQQRHAISKNLFMVQKKGKDNKSSKPIYVFNEEKDLIDVSYGLHETAKKYNMKKTALYVKITKNVTTIINGKKIFFSNSENPKDEKIKKTTGIKIREVNSNLIFANYQEALQHFNTTWKSVNTSIKEKKEVLGLKLVNGKREKRYYKFELLEAQQTIES